LDIPFMTDHPDERPGRTRRTDSYPFEDCQTLDRGNGHARDGRYASNTPVTCGATCEHDRDRHATQIYPTRDRAYSEGDFKRFTDQARRTPFKVTLG
jgi:hypothetical protein